MRSKKTRVILLVGNITPEMNASYSWMEAGGIKVAQDTDKYGESMQLRGILSSILKRQNGWVLDTKEDSTQFTITDEERGLLKAYFTGVMEETLNEGVVDNTLLVKDGRCTVLLSQLISFFKDDMNWIPYAVYLDGADEELAERVSPLCDDPLKLVSLYRKSIEHAKKVQKGKFKIFKYNLEDFPEDVSTYPIGFWEAFVKARILKEIPEFE